MREIPYGLCQCGCGQKTNLAGQDSTRNGWKRGEPVRFVSGHNGRRTGPEYIETDCGYTTPCWVWQGTRIRDGYGQKDRRMAHAVYYERVHGPIPGGLQIDHLCRNHPCVNPEHLEAVTPAENVRRSPRTKLTVEKVREIRTRVATGETQHAVAADYGVTRACVATIMVNRNWRDV